jgi:quinol monooxygenase YgiN
MASMLIQHQVKSFTAWKTVFDSAVDLRKRHGELSSTIYQSESDPNNITVVNRWDSLANAHKFAQSPDLKAAMEKSGVEGHPVIFFLNEV